MAQKQYKVYAHFPDKSTEIRRFCIDRNVVNSFPYLDSKLQNVFPALNQKHYSVHWKDEDNDDVLITSDEDLAIAMLNLNMTTPIKLYVHVTSEVTDDTVIADPENNCGLESGCHHFGVICDKCDKVVVGFRYKCTTCHDFDLCASCEATGAHAQHCMLRIPNSMMAPEAIKEVLKRTRHFMKSFNGTEEGHHGHKKHKRDRSAEKKHKEQHRRERRECRRPRAGWLETVTAYMNEFVNLAGDIDLSPPAADSRRHAQTNTGPEQEPRPGPAADAEMPQAPEPQPGPSAPPPIGFVGATPRITPEMQRFLNQVDSMWANMFNAKFTDMFVPRDADTSMDSPVSGEGRRGSGDSQRGGSGDRQRGGSGDSERGGSGDSRASSVSSNARGDGDKADDWTLLNKENDLADEAAAKTAAAPAAAATTGPATAAATAPVLDPATLTFNLPREFQERVSIGQSLYPPLNSNTAVLNPDAPEFPPPEQARAGPARAGAGAGADQTPTAAQSPKTPATTRKLKPHVAAALQHMLAMGFNNDGEWITQLLENYDGNIAAVLDLLTPVNAKKK